MTWGYPSQKLQNLLEIGTHGGTLSWTWAAGVRRLRLRRRGIKPSKSTLNIRINANNNNIRYTSQYIILHDVARNLDKIWKAQDITKGTSDVPYLHFTTSLVCGTSIEQFVQCFLNSTRYKNYLSILTYLLQVLISFYTSEHANGRE